MRKLLTLTILAIIAIVSAAIWVIEGYRPFTFGVIAAFISSVSSIITIIAHDSQSQD